MYGRCDHITKQIVMKVFLSANLETAHCPKNPTVAPGFLTASKWIHFPQHMAPSPSSVSARNSCRVTNLAKSPLRPGRRNHSWPVLEIMSWNGAKNQWRKILEEAESHQKKTGWSCETRNSSVHQVYCRMANTWKSCGCSLWGWWSATIISEQVVQNPKKGGYSTISRPS